MPPKPKASELCPCGSGKKYRQCCAVKQERRKRTLRRAKKAVIWIGAAAAVVLALYGISQTAGVAYDDGDIQVVDFSALDQSQKRDALRAVNNARCPCGCGMTLARCVVTDSTCPLRTKNIERIRATVAEHSS